MNLDCKKINWIMAEKKEKNKHILVDEDTHNKARLLAAIKGKTMKEAVKEAVEAELKK